MWNIIFYHLDAYESPKDPAWRGKVVLFGKIQQDLLKESVLTPTADSGDDVETKKEIYKSCAVIVQGIQRSLYFEKKSQSDVQSTRQEIAGILGKSGVYSDLYTLDDGKKSVRPPPTPDGVKGGEPPSFINLNYSFMAEELDNDLSGETFSRVYGTKSSALELLLLQAKIKGPCWLMVKGAQRVASVSSQLTTCHVEFTCSMDDLIHVTSLKNCPATPKLSIVSLQDESIHSQKRQLSFNYWPAVSIENSTLPTDESVYGSQESLWSTYDGDGNGNDNDNDMDKKDSHGEKERHMIEEFLDKIAQLDPDMVVGHGLFANILPFLHRRVCATQSKGWSYLTRLRGQKLNTNTKWAVNNLSGSGRLLCDTQTAAEDLMQHSRSYELYDLLAEADLPSLMPGFSAVSTSASIATLQLMHHLAIVPLSFQLTNICGNLWSKNFQTKSSQNRVEYLLLHAFYEQGYIVPDKKFHKYHKDEDDNNGIQGDKASLASGGGSDSSYEGGLVLEPKRGFYDTYVLLFDFNSLYPSIIQEFDLCLCQEKILPKIMANLVDQRRKIQVDMVKLTMATSRPSLDLRLKKANRDEVSTLDIRQKALKLTANATYGCVGSTFGRFYNPSLAAEITSRGRDALRKTVQVAKDLGFKVIYGDTDSIMILTNEREYDGAVVIANKLRQDFKRLLNFLILNLGLDRIFKRLLIQQKKKYAAINAQTNEMETKGLEITRRDWSPLANRVGQAVLELVMGVKAESVPSHVLEAFYSDRVTQTWHYTCSCGFKSKQGFERGMELDYTYKLHELEPSWEHDVVVAKAFVMCQKYDTDSRHRKDYKPRVLWSSSILKYEIGTVQEMRKKAAKLLQCTDCRVRASKLSEILHFKHRGDDLMLEAIDQILSAKYLKNPSWDLEINNNHEQIYKYLKNTRQDVEDGKIPLVDYVMRRKLTKQVSEYKDAKSQPHVQVAMHMQSSGKGVNVGQSIPFIVCQGDESQSMRCFHPSVVENTKGNLLVDKAYYLEEQIFKPISRS